MNIIPLEMTQGDPFYYELGFVDAYGNPLDITAWGIQVDFKELVGDTAPLCSLTIGNEGLAALDIGVISLQFDATALDGFDICPRPRNGDLLPWRWLYADVKLTPPSGVALEQGAGARTLIPIKVYLGITA